jgi:tetratricopeptide (TPR) repeat protein
MNKTVTLIAVGALGAGMFVAGALGPFAPMDSPAAQPVASEIDPLSPAGGARSLDATVRALQSRLRDHPNDTASVAHLGLAYLQQGRVTSDPSYFPKASRLFARALASDPNSEAALIGSGLLANAQHRFAEGLKLGRKARRVNAYGTEALGVITDSLVELGRYQEAARVLQKMVNLRPDLASFSRISYLRELNGDYPGAIAAMREALRATPQLGEDASWVRVQLGDLLFGSGRLPEAEQMYVSASEVAPDYYLPQIGIARVEAAENNLEAAIRRMENVVARYPAPQHVIFLAELLAVSGDREGADRQAALVEAQRRLFTDGGVIPDVELTVFYADHGRRLYETLALARRQYAARPSIRTADALAWTLHALGRDRRALELIGEALGLDTRDALLRYHAGVIASAAGDRSAARRHIETALRINPHFSVFHSAKAERLLKELRS